MEKEKTVVFPSSVLLTVDSKDRNQTSTQPWNSFTLQKPQALLDAFAKKLMVSEVRFPWYIPNITPRNNTFIIVGEVGVDPNSVQTFVIPPGFYTPTALIAVITTAIGTRGFTDPPVLKYDPLSSTYTFIAGGTQPFTLYWFDPVAYTTAPTEQQYNTTASLMRTMGFNYEQVSGSQSNSSIQGQPTQTLYTNYIDIVSTRLTRFQKVRDGDSANNSQSSTVCRLYLADEASNPLVNFFGTFQAPASGVGIGNFPFVIHRQFKTPKAINWTPDNFVDYFDISVLDEYNNLVPLLPQPYGVGLSGNFNAQYPDFQITFICSE